jgi:hypothetical protein
LVPPPRERPETEDASDAPLSLEGGCGDPSCVRPDLDGAVLVVQVSTWILILWSISFVGHFATIHSTRFASKQACVAALAAAHKGDGNIEGVCVEDAVPKEFK